MDIKENNISRRNFIKLSGMTGTVLALGFSIPSLGKEAKVVKLENIADHGLELNAWISIDTSGKVTITNHRAEMGQGSFQSVPQIIAEELEVSMDAIHIVFAPSNNKKYGSQITGGSSTIRDSYKKLLHLSATTREMLIEAAAQKWKVAHSECYAENGHVVHRSSGKKAHYGELVESASKLPLPKDVKLKETSTYKILRKPLPRRDTPLKVNGKAEFGLDKKLPGMMYAVVERNTRFSGKVKSFDDKAAKAVPGVKHVFIVKREVFSHLREGVAVVADTLWAAMQGRKVLKVEWDDTGFEHYSTAQLYSKMKEQLKSGNVINYKSKGSVDNALKKSEKTLEALYETPYESHSCMEPLNCIAHVHDGKCEVWGPIQAPDWIQEDLSEKLGMPLENVTVHMTFLGGGFGRKAFTDYPHEAVMISQEIKAPVQVVWSREDDTQLGPFRPGMVYQCKGGLNKDGKITGFETLMAGQNMGQQSPDADKTSYNDSVTEGLLEPYFDSLPHYRFGDAPLDVPIPVMWWRSVYASTNAFAFESFMDEMAHAAGKDPLEFRRKHLHKDRYRKLIDKIEEKTNWKSRGKNEGWGVAIAESFSSVVAEAVKVSRKPGGGVKVDKVVVVMDCGWYVNPDIISAQVEGSIVMALGAATKHASLFEDGKAVHKNFDTYKMSRINEVPEIEVHVVDNDENAGGVGEPGLPPFTPALTNAIFDLTGKRIRVLPFDLDTIS